MILNENIKNYYKNRIIESIELHEAPGPRAPVAGPPINPFSVRGRLRRFLDPIGAARDRLSHFQNYINQRQILGFDGRPVHFDGAAGTGLNWQVTPLQPTRFYAQDITGKWHCYEQNGQGSYQRVKLPRDFNPESLGLNPNPSAPTGGRNANRVVPGAIGGWIGSESGEENETGPLDTGDVYPPALAPYVAT